MTAPTNLACPCESGIPYSQCCGPILNESKQAETAEALMRSRYTAYTRQDWHYLVMSTHPSCRPASLLNELQANHSDEPAHWCGLKILSTSAGQASDTMGKVNFEASFFKDGKVNVLREHSRFKRFKGIWKYLDANG